VPQNRGKLRKRVELVKILSSSTAAVPRQKRSQSQSGSETGAVIPVVHTPYDYFERI